MAELCLSVQDVLRGFCPIRMLEMEEGSHEGSVLLHCEGGR